ncbi:MAG TPA: site-specific DNA-methyltransferase [Candidatus Xenobia bacterium]
MAVELASRSARPWWTREDVALYQGNCLAVLPTLSEKAMCIFADPPYFLSNGGVTCQAGRRVPVHKGDWDVSMGIEAVHGFNRAWLEACRDALDPNGTVWVSGTSHVIFSVGFAMQQLGFKILNAVTWFKNNAPPNLSCRYFTHSTETVLWAAPSTRARHKFNYRLMKEMGNGRQMRDVWQMRAPGPSEKQFGKHPTQKPLQLLERIVLASTDAGDLVLDPFCGSGTTGVAAQRAGRRFIGIEIEKPYLELARQRLLSAP